MQGERARNVLMTPLPVKKITVTLSGVVSTGKSY